MIMIVTNIIILIVISVLLVMTMRIKSGGNSLVIVNFISNNINTKISAF